MKSVKFLRSLMLVGSVMALVSCSNDGTNKKPNKIDKNITGVYELEQLRPAVASVESYEIVLFENGTAEVNWVIDGKKGDFSGTYEIAYDVDWQYRVADRVTFSGLHEAERSDVCIDFCLENAFYFDKDWSHLTYDIGSVSVDGDSTWAKFVKKTQ